MNYFAIVLLGVGLAMDASCVCTCNGLVYRPNWKNTIKIAFPFGLFQGIMPLIGYFGIGFLPEAIFVYQPVIALVLLCAVGLKMIVDALQHIRKNNRCPSEIESCAHRGKLSLQMIFVQALSTSIDALTVGANYATRPLSFMLLVAAIVAVITFVLCILAVQVGIRLGTKLNNKAEILGGAVLVILGIYLFLENM